MPNQLARNKRRKSIAEHEAVIALLEEVAREEHVSAMSLMRHAIRELVRKHIDDSTQRERFRSAASKFSPSPPLKFSSAKELSQFKKEQREFDQLLLDLHLEEPESIEESSSIVAPNCRIEVLDFE